MVKWEKNPKRKLINSIWGIFFFTLLTISAINYDHINIEVRIFTWVCTVFVYLYFIVTLVKFLSNKKTNHWVEFRWILYTKLVNIKPISGSKEKDHKKSEPLATRDSLYATEWFLFYPLCMILYILVFPRVLAFLRFRKLSIFLHKIVYTRGDLSHSIRSLKCPKESRLGASSLLSFFGCWSECFSHTN